MDEIAFAFYVRNLLRLVTATVVTAIEGVTATTTVVAATAAAYENKNQDNPDT